MKIHSYMLVTDTSQDELCLAIEDLMAEGYAPQGGVAICVNARGEEVMSQAMLRVTDDGVVADS